jgi:hypothetical protein
MHSAGTLNLHHKAVGLSSTRFAIKGVTDRFVKNCTLRSLRSPPAIALLASGNPIEWIQKFFGGLGDAVRESNCLSVQGRDSDNVRQIALQVLPHTEHEAIPGPSCWHDLRPRHY